jgi:hypothetical protein
LENVVLRRKKFRGWIGTLPKRKNGSVEILSLFILFKKAMRVTPFLSGRGRQPKGDIPLTPFLYISLVLKESFSSTSRELPYFLLMSHGGRGKGSRNPIERQNNFPMDSTKPKKTTIP